MLRDFLSRQFIYFLITGGIAALVNFSSRIVFSQWFSFSIAIILAYLLGMVTAFVLAKVFVFKKSSHSNHVSAMYFTLVNVAAVAQTWIVSMVLAYLLLPALGVVAYVEEISHAIGIAVPAFTSYLGHKYLSFRA